MSEIALALVTLLGVLATALPAVLSNVGKRARLALIRAQLSVYREIPKDDPHLEYARERLAREIDDVVIFHDARPGRWKAFQHYYIPVVGSSAALAIGTVLLPGERVAETARNYASAFFLVLSVWFAMGLVAHACAQLLEGMDRKHQRRANDAQAEAAKQGTRLEEPVKYFTWLSGRLGRRKGKRPEVALRFIVQDVGALAVAAMIYLVVQHCI